MSVIVWAIGLVGLIVNRGNIIVMLLSMEILLLGAIWSYGEGVVAVGGVMGEIIIIGIITVAAGETAIGLSLIVGYYRLKGNIGVRAMCLLRG